MPRRPLLVGGVVALVTGSLLLALGLDWGRGEVRAAATSVSAPSAPSASSAPTPSVSGPTTAGPASSASPTPTSTTPRPPAPKRSSASTATQPQRRVSGAGRTTNPAPAPVGLGLSVPSIGLATSLISGGADSSGTISPPAGRAMWVRGYGRVKPGNVGTAVVAGHVVASGHDDVFARLSSVRVGNTVVVRTGTTTRTYVVRRAAVVKKVALTRDTDVWGANSSKRRIVLITCDDELGYRSDGHRVANYVVVADAV